LILLTRPGRLSKHIAYVPQDPDFFPGSVYYNIAYGRPEATPEEVSDAARAVGLHDDIMDFPHQYQEYVLAGAT
jgi:ATP-binding cassette subfamily B protein